MKNIGQIWKALDAGKTVCWSNRLYEIEVVSNNNTESSAVSARGDEALRITCTSNGFGAYITESEIESCYIKE